MNHLLSAPSPSTKAHQEALASQGFTVVRNAIPADLLADCQAVLATWVEDRIAAWLAAGRLTAMPTETDGRRRFLAAWNAAGRPGYSRSPRSELVKLDAERMYRILSHPALVDLAADLLTDDTIVSHAIWNSRPKAPDQRFTDTPWHQDAQYFPAEATCRMVNLWFPLHDVEADESCLAFAPGYHRHGLYRNDPDAEGTGFIGLTREDAATLPGEAVPLRRGDVVCFTNLTPHRALANRSDRMRWSFDLRFVTGSDASPAALAKGIVCRHPDSACLTPFERWRAAWDDGTAR